MDNVISVKLFEQLNFEKIEESKIFKEFTYEKKLQMSGSTG